jgi:ferrochelatase
MKGQKKIGVLLINIGTPVAPTTKAIRRYLVEFLTDKRVIDVPRIWREILVRFFIIPGKIKESVNNYRAVWTKAGSPLMIHSLNFKTRLAEALGNDFQVEIGMRYSKPYIQEALQKMHGLRQIIVLPLFPQYASATSGSATVEVMQVLKKWPTIPSLSFVHGFTLLPKMIDCFALQASQLSLKKYDHILFSFHGLPEGQIYKADSFNHCLRTQDCCRKLSDKNVFCYKAQCHATAEEITKKLSLHSENTTICFQSRLGKDPWLTPYTKEILLELAANGKKRVLVFCPSFVADCVETLYEIQEEYGKEFLLAGGEKLDLVPSLNDHPLWVEGVKNLIFEHSVLGKEDHLSCKKL